MFVNCRVAAIYANKRSNSPFLLRSLASDRASAPAGARMFLLCCVYAGHIRRKCGTVSRSLLQAGHVGESVAFIRCRCAWSGAWPVRSCINRLALYLLNPSVSFKNDVDGSDLSIFAIFFAHDDCVHSLFAFSLICALIL